MNLLVVCSVLFVIGAVQDWASAVWLNAVKGERYKLASFISIVHTFVSYAIFVGIMEQMLTGDWVPLMAYSIGGGLGTFVGLKRGTAK